MSEQDPVIPQGCVPLEDLSALVDAELAPADAERVASHAASCARCGALLSRLGGTSRLLASLPRERVAEDRVREVAAHAAQGVAAQAAQGGAPHAARETSAESRRGERRPWMRWAAAAAALLGAFVVFRVAHEVSRTSEAPAMKRSESIASRKSAEIASPEPAPQATNEVALADAAAAGPAAETFEAKAVAEAASSGEAATLAQPASPPPPQPAEIASALAFEEGQAEAEATMMTDDAVGGREADRAEAGIAARSKDEAARQREDQPAPAIGAAAPAIAPAARAQSSPVEQRGARLAGAQEGAATPAPSCTRPRPLPEDQPMHPGDGIEPPLLLEQPAPSLATWPEGGIRVEAIVELDGSLTPCRIEPALDPESEASLRATLALWRYRPARLEGRPQATHLLLRLHERR